MTTEQGEKQICISFGLEGSKQVTLNNANQ